MMFRNLSISFVRRSPDDTVFHQRQQPRPRTEKKGNSGGSTMMGQACPCHFGE
ncbi:hypothetical protein ES332_D11G317100v1 [Gossypium tomentosum]|uniref:Uncharacterized protein n=1 Tax=Gossypium tomentosum TaxID=34277 RepID=A0A5D2IUV1_GOSTO|nr:hypothetical protein ES332_D11G317100v1 [Gossypium tomentosum]